MRRVDSAAYDGVTYMSYSLEIRGCTEFNVEERSHVTEIKRNTTLLWLFDKHEECVGREG
jgi:hypothetical protein